ncbi:MAG: hypothetical protein R3B90_04610 [Planctomycetaceae bacterium]
MPDQSHLEAELTLAAQRLNVHYVAALAIVEPLAAHPPLSAVAAEPRLRELRRQMRLAAELEDQLQPLRAAWNNSGADAGPKLRHLITGQRQLLSKLLAEVNRCESQWRTAYGEARPTVDRELRQQECRTAYARGRR